MPGGSGSSRWSCSSASPASSWWWRLASRRWRRSSTPFSDRQCCKRRSTCWPTRAARAGQQVERLLQHWRSENGVDERRQRLDASRHHQDEAGDAEEHDQRDEPLPPGIAAPQPADAVGDGRTRAAEHDQHARDAGTPLDHATASSAPPVAARFFATSTGPQTSKSMPERRKVEYASTARFTIGSPARLKLVLSSTGTPVRRPTSSSKAWNRGAISRSTVCTRAVPSTCVTAASRSRHSRRTGKTPDMYRASRAPPGGSSKNRSACSMGTAGAKGLNSSRNLMLRLSLSRI